jgi:hypothetical protein
MMSFIKVSLLMALGVILAGEALAQDDISKQLWLDYNLGRGLENDLEFYGDFGLRTELNESGWGRLVARPGVRGPWGSFRWSAGLGGFYTVNEEISDRLEIRPYQGLSATWPRGRVPFHHYFRLEERFDFAVRNWDVTASLRLRYRIQIQLLWSGIKGKAHWRALLHSEAFATLTGEAGQFDEHWRIGFGVERVFGSAYRIRLDLTWQKSGLPLSGGETNDLYIRIRLFHD